MALDAQLVAVDSLDLGDVAGLTDTGLILGAGGVLKAHVWIIDDHR